MPSKISTLSGFIKWTEQFNDGQYLFRGVSKAKYKIEASACRRLPEEDRNNVNKLLKINQEMLEKAKRLGHDREDGHQRSDLDLLAELQHYGAATCLIDFTRNPMFALWFACRKSSSKPQKNGKVVVLRNDDPDRFKTVDYELSKADLRYFFEQHNGKYPLYQWEPKHQNNRIIAQQSVFVFGSATVEPTHECVVVESCKENILNSLEKSLGVTEASMFPDFYGFADRHSQFKDYVEPNAQGYLDRGVEAHLEGNLDEAIGCYTEAILLDPDPFIAVKAYTNRGIAYRSKGDFNAAIEDYSKAIELNPEDAKAYTNRGVAYAVIGEFDAAIEDYSKAIELNPEDAEAYTNRGIAYRSKGDFNVAIEDYSKAIELNPEDAEAYANCGKARLHLQEWDNARADLNTAKEMGFDIVASFHNNYGSVAAFEEQHGVQVPGDIAALLSRD